VELPGDERGEPISRPTAPARRAAGLSLTEIVVGALIIGLSALPILELSRSSTVHLQVSHTEAVARAVAADVLERFASPVHGEGRQVGTITQSVLGAPAPWQQIIKADPYLSYRFPRKLESVLENSQVKISLDVKTVSHPALAPSTGVQWYTVTVSFKDRYEGRTEVTLGRFVDRW
jgi:hypothetical protein